MDSKSQQCLDFRNKFKHSWNYHFALKTTTTTKQNTRMQRDRLLFLFLSCMEFKTRCVLQGISHSSSFTSSAKWKEFFLLFCGENLDTLMIACNRKPVSELLFLFFLELFNLIMWYYSQNACVKHSKSLQKIIPKECYIIKLL